MTSLTVAQHALEIPRSGIRDVFDRADKVPDAISLCVGEPQDTAAPHIEQAACRAIYDGRTKYTNVLGVGDFRKAVHDYTLEVKGLDYDPDREIEAVDGATIGLFLALRTVVDPGSEVIIPSPFFTSYEADVLMCGATPVTVALKPENGMRLNAADIEAAVTSKTRAIIINSPGNPTGAVTSAQELGRIAEVCLRHGIWAISDEVYHPFVFEDGMEIAPSIASMPHMHDHTIVVDSLSKTFAMTGWRIGYILAPHDVIEVTGKLAEHMHSSVNSITQYAAVAALDGPRGHIRSMRREYARKRQIVIDELSGCSALRLMKPNGAFYAFVDIRPTGMGSQTFSRRLLSERHVAVVPGEAFGKEGAGFVRLSYAGDADELEEGVRRLRRFADDARDPSRSHAAAQDIEITA